MIKIFIVCHRPAYVPRNSLFYPIQVGAALAGCRYEGMLYDDIGENISAKNGTYCELTAQYWVWKNEDADYYGFFHYRRYLSLTQVFPVDGDGNLKTKKRPSPYREQDRIPEDLKAYGLDAGTVSGTVEPYDIVAVMRERLNLTVYQQFSQYHDRETLDHVMRILREKYPPYSRAADSYLSSKEIYYMNMFIMRRELFREYCGWLFDILGTYEEQAQGTEIKPRLMGYLAERLFGVFYLYQREKGAQCAEVPYIKFYDTRPAVSAGGSEDKIENYREFQIGSADKKIKIDMRKFNRLFPAGSRRRLILRSIFLRKS